MGLGTTRELESEIPQWALRSMKPLLLQPATERAISRIEAIEDAIDVLLAEMAGAPFEEAREALAGVFRRGGLSGFPDDTFEPAATTGDELLVGVSAVLAAWRLLRVDAEKLAGHLLIDHGVSNVPIGRAMKPLVEAHVRQHEL